MIVCVAVMLHKRYLNISLGIDCCLVLVLLASSKYGILAGIIAGAGSFLLGMTISLQISKNPMMTIYGTLFYSFVAIVYTIIPINTIYNAPLLHIAIVSIPFTIGALLVGAPMHFLIRYVPTNIITNLLFFQVFSGLLRLLF